MFLIRLYVAALTVMFLLVSVMTTGVGVLHAIVLVCATLYSILDIRQDLHGLKQLEARVSALSR